MIKWLDFKVTTWERVFINDKVNEEELLQKLKTKEIESVSDMYDNYENLSSELLTEHSEQLSTKENSGSATIEVYSEDSSIIFDNSKDIITLKTHKKKKK